MAACLLILVGAFAKSAQLPLHTWLPDAMEGPTPVSALIHAATMVTAGVYLIARMYPLFELAPTAADVSAIIGTATLVFAATVAVTVTDLKRVIAYSTISQIGYMVLGVSAAAYGAGMFHLMTHAFFKALLFMCAGSVIAAMAGNQDLDKMGGFRKAMPFTFAAFLIGALALVRLPAHVRLLLEGRDPRLHAQPRRRSSSCSACSATSPPGSPRSTPSGSCSASSAASRCPRRARWRRAGWRTTTRRTRSPVRRRTPTWASPVPSTTWPSARLRCGPRWGRWRCWRWWPARSAVPGLTDTIEHFLEPTFEESRFHDQVPSDGAEWIGLFGGGLVSIAGIAAAYHVYVRRPGLAAHDARALRRGAPLPRQQVVLRRALRPALRAARSAPPATSAAAWSRPSSCRARSSGGATGVVRAGTSLARAVQTGYVRAYALTLLAGLGGLALYFLISST